MTAGVHSHFVDVRWGHCDPAGIVYFPKFFDMFHEAMESWFSARLQAPYDEVITGRKVGFPAVHTEADFQKPTAFGERVEVRLTVERLGRSSLTLCYEVRGPGGETDVRLRGKTVCAVMNLDEADEGFRRAMPLPDDLRASVEAFGIAR